MTTAEEGEEEMGKTSTSSNNNSNNNGAPLEKYGGLFVAASSRAPVENTRRSSACSEKTSSKASRRGTSSPALAHEDDVDSGDASTPGDVADLGWSKSVATHSSRNDDAAASIAPSIRMQMGLAGHASDDARNQGAATVAQRALLLVPTGHDASEGPAAKTKQRNRLRLLQRQAKTAPTATKSLSYFDREAIRLRLKTNGTRKENVAGKIHDGSSQPSLVHPRYQQAARDNELSKGPANAQGDASKPLSALRRRALELHRRRQARVEGDVGGRIDDGNSDDDADIYCLDFIARGHLLEIVRDPALHHFCETAALLPWHSDPSLLVDRHDARLLLDEKRDFKKKKRYSYVWTQEAREVEQQCDRERYRDLVDSHGTVPLFEDVVAEEQRVSLEENPFEGIEFAYSRGDQRRHRRHLRNKERASARTDRDGAAISFTYSEDGESTSSSDSEDDAGRTDHDGPDAYDGDDADMTPPASQENSEGETDQLSRTPSASRRRKRAGHGESSQSSLSPPPPLSSSSSSSKVARKEAALIAAKFQNGGDTAQRVEPLQLYPYMKVVHGLPLPHTNRQLHIIERTAHFLVKQPARTEILMKTREAGNAWMAFLKPGDALNPLYQHFRRLCKDDPNYIPSTIREAEKPPASAPRAGEKGVNDDVEQRGHAEARSDDDGELPADTGDGVSERGDVCERKSSHQHQCNSAPKDAAVPTNHAKPEEARHIQAEHAEPPQEVDTAKHAEAQAASKSAATKSPSLVCSTLADERSDASHHRVQGEAADESEGGDGVAVEEEHARKRPKLQSRARASSPPLPVHQPVAPVGGLVSYDDSDDDSDDSEDSDASEDNTSKDNAASNGLEEQQSDARQATIPSVEVVVPPPDTKAIADKLATYIAKNGSGFLQTVIERKGADARFAFLHEGHLFYPYFVEILREERSRLSADLPPIGTPVGLVGPPSTTTTTTTTTTTATTTSVGAAENAVSAKNLTPLTSFSANAKRGEAKLAQKGGVITLSLPKDSSAPSICSPFEEDDGDEGDEGNAPKNDG